MKDTMKFNVILSNVLNEKHRAGVPAFKELLKDVQKDAEQVLVAAFSSTR